MHSSLKLIFVSGSLSEKGADRLGEHARVVRRMRLQHTLLVFLGKLHGLEDDADQVDLHLGVIGHEVGH